MKVATQAEVSLIHEILELPNAPMIVQRVHTALEKEKEKRGKFYNDISEQEKAEFINGEIIIHSPVVKIHNEISSNVYRLIDAYVFEKNLGFVGIEKILIKLTRNDYEPDVCFFNKEKSKAFKDSQKFFPSPDLIVEILSKGTEKRDRGIKFQDYQAHEVTEYWIIDPGKKIIEQYVLANSSYVLKVKSNSGVIASMAIQGLKFSVSALFDRKDNYTEIRKILGK